MPKEKLSAREIAASHIEAALDTGVRGELREALKKAAEGFAKAKAKYGRHSIFGIASGRAPHEAAYSMQKFIRAGFGTHHIDNCSRA